MPSMSRTLLLGVLLASTSAMTRAADPAPADDPYIWLEQVSSPESHAWVEAENLIGQGPLLGLIKRLRRS